MGKRSVLVVLLSTMALVVPASASGDPLPSQFDHSAAFRVDNIATSDPCVVAFASGAVTDFIDDSLTDLAAVSLGLADVCGEYPWSWVPLYEYVSDFHPISEDAFTVSPSLATADLQATFTAFDNVAQIEEPVTVVLHWESPNGVARDAAVVTGSLASPRLTVELDDSIVWSDWASIQDPDVQPPITIAGLWLCNFRGVRFSTPGCPGQTR